MGRLEVEDVEDSLDEVIVVLAEELSDHFVVVLQDLFEGQMDGVFLQLDRVVYDHLQPLLTDVEFCDWVVFDDLPDQVVGSVEDGLQCLIFSLEGFVDFLKNFLSNLSDNGEQFGAYFEIHANILKFLIGQHFCLDIGKTAVFDEGN